MQIEAPFSFGKVTGDRGREDGCCNVECAGAAGYMSSGADNDPRNDPESWSSTVLLVGRFLTVLRLVTIGCLVAILAAMSQADIVTAPPWEDNLVGGALLAYAVVA